MRKTALLVLAMLTSVMTMKAQQVSVGDAMARAKAFMAKGNVPRRLPGKIGTTTTVPELELAYTETRDADQKVCFYVFNYSDDSGFIIMGGDEAAKEVLAYSDQGSFDYDKAPANFKWWLSQYEEQISYAMDNAALMTPRKTSAASTGRTNISPLVTTKWDQESPYWNAVNADMKSQNSEWSSNVLTGCVATAMAQVMNYHECPSQTGTGSKSYSQTINSYKYTFSANFGNTTYDWGNMLDDYSGDYSDDEANAVATLMYHAGVAVSMSYGTGGSGAYPQNIADALVSYFGYDKSIRFEQRNYITDERWCDKLYNELANGRPIIYSGYTKSNAGHCFVCDGYRASDETFHFNWGWGGYCDCYCVMTGSNALKPGGTGSGGAGAEDAYNVSQGAVINVMPNENGVPAPVIFNLNGTIALYDGDTKVNSYTHKHGDAKTLKLQENVYNGSSFLSSFTLGVKATDIVTGYVHYWADATAGVPPMGYGGSCSANFDVNELPYNGTYRVQLVGRNSSSTSDDDWYDVECNSSVVFPTVTITGATDPDKRDVVFTINNDDVEVSRTVQISPESLYDGTASYTSADESIATVSADGVVTGVAPGDVNITAVADGNMYFNKTTQVIKVTVREFQRDDVNVTISATGLYKGQTATISITSDYDGTPQYSSSDETVATVDTKGTVTAVDGGNATITVTIPETKKYNGKTVSFDVNVTGDDIYLTETPYFMNDNNPWSGDTFLYYSVKNNTTSSTTVYFLVMLYKITDSGDVRQGGHGTYFTLGASSTRSDAFDMSLFSLEEGVTYRAEFLSKTDWTTHYNIPSITFTYRDKVDVDLKIGTAGYATLILPFNAEIPTADNGGNNVDWKAYECVSLAGNTMELKQVTTLERNTPYLFSGSTQGTYTFTGPKAVDDSPELFGDGVLKGTMLTDKYLFKDGDYILQNHNGRVAFYKYNSSDPASANWYASPYRAFLQVDKKATFSCFNFPTITGIAPVVMSNVEGLKSKAGIYSVDGVKRNTLQKGLNVIVDEDGVTRKMYVK